ncbi:MAG: hypothetical protein WDO74_17925 [Pseudomonadota bacterium]
MAKIVNVTDVPELPGAGLLHFDDGRPPLMALPEIADEHRERLGMSALRDGVAGPGTGTPDPVEADKQDFVNTMKSVGNWFTTPVRPLTGPGTHPSAPEPAAPPPVQQAAPAPPQAPPPGVAGVPPGIAAPPPSLAPEAAPPTTDELIAQANDSARRRAADELVNGKIVPGTAGHPAGYIPTAQKTTTEQGPAYDVDAARDRLDAGSMVLQAQMAKAVSEKEQADAMAAHAAAQNLAAQQRVKDEQAEILRKQQVYQEQDQKLQADLADYSESAKPDPNRFYSSPIGAFSGVLSIIGQGLGAFGATLGRTENWAFQAAQQKMRLEMAAQEKAYDAGRGDRRNALARLTEYYHGDIDKAKLALSQALNKVAETETLAFGAQAKSKDIAANAKVLAAQFQQQQLLDEQKRVELAQGKTTTESTDKYREAVAASGPHRKDLTRAERDDDLKITGGAKPPEDQGFGGLKAKDIVDTGVKYAERKQDVIAGREGLNEEAKAYGLSINWATGEVIGPDGRPVNADKVDIPGIGRIKSSVPGMLITDEGNDVRRAQTKSVSAYLHAMSGSAFSAKEEENARNVTLGVSPRDAVVTLSRRVNEVKNMDQHLDASVPKPIVDEYNRRATESKREQSKGGGYNIKPGTGQ